MTDASEIFHPEVTRIRPSAGWRALSLGEIWRYRELLFFLTWRDVKLRYKQTALGVAWVVIQPLFTMLVFTLFFGKLGGMAEKTDSDPSLYSVFVMVALTPWQLFSFALSQSSNSLVNEQRLITKVYFPRLIVPVASVLSGLVDFLVSFALVLGFMAWHGVTPGWGILALPLLVLFCLATALSVGLWLSCLNVQYRDIRYTIPFLTQFWLFVSPVAYASKIVPEAYRWLYGLNPIAGVIEGFRWALLGTPAPPLDLIAASAGMVMLLFVGGLYYFQRLERSFADVV